MTTQTVATTILQQLGGNKFCVMTGAKNFLSTPTSLSMKVGRNSKGVTHVKVDLTPADTYTVTSYRCGPKVGINKREEHLDVYCNQLQATFTELTGLYTYL